MAEAGPAPAGEGGAGPERRLSARARKLLAGGPGALDPLPTPERLAGQPAPDRHRLLEGRRIELYAIASLVADATVRRARRDRDGYPPYGLARSMFSQTRMVVSSPEPYKEGSIDGFLSLGSAYLDTVVFHLDQEMIEVRRSERAWLAKRLEALLALYRVDAGPAQRARLHDGFTFMYGGLHFGTTVCLQMIEVMSRMLDAVPGVTAVSKAAVIARSLRAPYELAALNVDGVPIAYGRLQAPGEGPAGTQWMGSDHFVMQPSAERPSRIDLRPGSVVTVAGGDGPATYTTHGCPARVSPSGASPPIAGLWTWLVELALATGLLAGRSGDHADPASN